ncbi:MAG: FAD-dependent oxidoreductase [Rhodospirillaceae bacterium]|nr:FAD-dependent oxidoreductase [Rhodospirillaceae bacterium]
MTAHPRLFTPFAIGPVALKNRVVVPGHTTNFAAGNLPTERHARYHEARARGGAGLIVTEAIRIHPTSAGRAATIAGYTDAAIPGLQAIVQAVRRHGGKIFAQLAHLGREAGVEHQLAASWGASPIPWGEGQHMPHAMTARDIKAAVAHFGQAAARMVRAGFDGIELHFGHGHLIAQFLSRATNQRTDGYGGPLENRIRFGREVLAEVLRHAGPLPVGLRISAHEFLPDGLDPDQMVEIVACLRAEFPVAFLNVSHAAYVHGYSLATQIADASFDTAPFKAFPARFKQEFPDLPIIAVCRVDDLATAEGLLADGVADLVGLARPHIADPELVAKAQGGRADQVRACIACNQGCIGRVEQGSGITCVANPEAGFEAAWDALRARPAPPPRAVAVVGGGPAGLEAAVAAARRGHQVTLFERGDHLGGAFREAASLPGRARFARLIEDLARDARAAGVAVKLATPFTPTDARAFDSVIVAAGCRDVVRAYDGIAAVGPRDALAAPEALGDHVAIIDERGTWHAYGLAELLARHGARVHLVTPVAGFAWRVTLYTRLGLLQRLADLKVASHLQRRAKSARDGNLILTDTLGGGEVEIAGLTGLVDVCPPRAEDRLYRELEGQVPELHVIGDAYAPRSVLEAVYEGRVIGTTLGDPAASLPAMADTPVYI